MHKGRIFRRILPPALTPNYAGNSHAPVFLQMDFTIVRGAGFFRGVTDLKIALVRYTQGLIVWSANFSQGFVDYQAVVTIQLIPHSPNHRLQVLFTDGDANVTVAEWNVAPDEGRWSIVGDNYEGDAANRTWAAPWGPILGITLRAIEYSLEPAGP
jgi:hypothetical protein